MNNFYKILPKKKSSKKRPSSAKRSNSLTEGSNQKKINNSIRIFTTYDEVFEKLNSKINKSGKFKANSASKKRKNSFSKKKQTPKKSIERKNLRNIYTYNTNYTTQDTDNNKIKFIKISPKKEKFNDILDKAKDLLSIQSDLVLQCGKLSQNLSKSDIDINTKMKNEINDNGNNALPGLARALYLLECKRDNKPINYNFKNNNNNIIEEEIENSFYIQILNELNKFIGELGYSYVYNEFDETNYKKENILIYFNNFHKLISILHQTINEQKDLLIKQANQIKEYEKYLQNYQYNNLENSISSKNDNQNVYINENESQNNMIENNNSNNSLFNNLSSNDFTQLQNCTNVFKNNNGNISQKNTHYFNSYMNNNNNEIYKEHNFNNLNESENNSNEFDKQSLPPEMSNNYLNYYKNQNQNKNMISSMINSESFFESYKRNKELKHNLNYNYNFDEKSVNNE